MRGSVRDKVLVPTEIGSNVWKKHPIKKVVSGGNHTLALTKTGKVYGWGESESGRTGRMIKSRSKMN